jgi:hypothetical protein
MLTDDGIFSQLVDFLTSPAFFHAAVGAAVGALIYAVYDWVQGTGGKPWGQRNTNNRG